MSPTLRRGLWIIGALLALAYIATALAGIVGCRHDPPAPSPPPVTTTTLPAPTCIFPGPLDVAALQPEQLFQQAVRGAQEALGDRCGYALDDGAPQVQSLQMLAAELRRRGYCAWQDEDRVVIQREPPPGKLWEERHAVYWGNGCWLAADFRRVLEEAP